MEQGLAFKLGDRVAHPGKPEWGPGVVMEEPRDLKIRVFFVDGGEKLLRLSPEGAALEAELFRALREKMGAAYAQAGQGSVTGFWRVLEGLIPEEDRSMVFGLRGR